MRSILEQSRDEVRMMAQQGIYNIKKLAHWEICKSLQGGKSITEVADENDLTYRAISLIKQKNCPECR